jgi:hypothetical protein
MTARAGRQQEQDDSKSRTTERARRRTARAGRQQEQDDSKSRATARAGSPATAETLAQQLGQQHAAEKPKINCQFFA